MFISFDLRTHEGYALRRGVVRLTSLSGSLILQRAFGVGADVPSEIPEGTYLIHTTSDGFIFNREQISLDDSSTSSKSSPFIITLRAVSDSANPDSERPFYVHGWLSVASVSRNVSQREIHGIALFDGPMKSSPVTHNIWFELIGPKLLPEGSSMLSINRVRISADRNGYFVADLKPESTYKVALPGLKGFRFFKTGSSGLGSNLKELMIAGSQPTFEEL